jgi:hypothetical protein
METIHAVKNIKAGEEITVSYLNQKETLPKEERQQALQAGFRFACICDLCSSSPAKIAASEKRMEEAQKLCSPRRMPRNANWTPTASSRETLESASPRRVRRSRCSRRSTATTRTASWKSTTSPASYTPSARTRHAPALSPSAGTRPWLSVGDWTTRTRRDCWRDATNLVLESRRISQPKSSSTGCGSRANTRRPRMTRARRVAEAFPTNVIWRCAPHMKSRTERRSLEDPGRDGEPWYGAERAISLQSGPDRERRNNL